MHEGRTLYRVDMLVHAFDGTRTRHREWGFRTVADAQQVVDQKLSERFLPPRKQLTKWTVRDAWKLYEEGASSRGVPTARTRFRHLDRHLGDMLVTELHPGTIDRYRNKRRGELLLVRKRDPVTGTIRELPRLRDGRTCFPSDCELDHELRLLQVIINHSVRCNRVPSNPLRGVRPLNTDNVRTSVISEADFARLLAAADEWLRPILIVAYDTGMRRGEILNLTWERIDLAARLVRLRADDTKANQARNIHLTERAALALESLGPRTGGAVFQKDLGGKKRLKKGHGLRNGFERAKNAAGMLHIWFHDLRRSFVTNARKRGVPESVVMKMSGHRTRQVFARYNIVDDGDLREAVKRIEQGQ